MKLTGKLKEDVEKAENKEKAKELIAEAGMELTDEEMDQVSGDEGGSEYITLTNPELGKGWWSKIFG